MTHLSQFSLSTPPDKTYNQMFLMFLEETESEFWFLYRCTENLMSKKSPNSQICLKTNTIQNLKNIKKNKLKGTY